MAKISDPKTIFSDIISDYQDIFEADLVSIILYGSATGPDFIPGKSDINFMIVLTEEGIDHLDRAFDVVGRWRKKGVAVPLFLTESYVQTSLDVYPIEYLNFQRNHQLVFGKDILKDLTVDPEFLRLQCEREVKGKLLLLREAFLETSGRPGPLKALAGQVLPAIIALFEALLYLKGEALPQKKHEVITAASKVLGIDPGVFEILLHIREGQVKPDREKGVLVFKACLREMRKLSQIVDASGE
ncbi:MAG: hypothetical protein R6U38_15740 [Desulfatiglandaceae bacterium]